jgi:hypothetical protein
MQRFTRVPGCSYPANDATRAPTDDLRRMSTTAQLHIERGIWARTHMAVSTSTVRFFEKRAEMTLEADTTATGLNATALSPGTATTAIL